MTLEIPGIRKAVLDVNTYIMLDEILRFRHFKRYYYNYQYDRDKLEYLEKKFLQSIPLVEENLDAFSHFLKALNS